MPATTFHVDAILFDMDGTLIDSTPGVVRAWENLRNTYPNVDIDGILRSSHGVRAIDILQTHCGIMDPQELESVAQDIDDGIITFALEDGKGIIPLPGVESIIKELAAGRYYPNPCWAICTSATRRYALSALGIAEVPIPDVFITSEDVAKGKPFPDPYLLGAEQCGVKPENCVVFEDAPSGVRSGRAAGCKTVGLLTSHSREDMEACQPDFLIKDLSSIILRRVLNGVEVTIHDQI
ncbi:HAD-like protein [Tricholoma matsutake]|nr:HAD-like protein [Tricholoma matsutake 945]